MRWTWIDRFVRFESGKSAVAVKNLSLAEDHFSDHFPGFPVMPAPLILEGLAQTGGILVGEANNYEKNVVLAKMNNVKIRREALAGEQLTYTATIVALNDTGAQVQASARSGNDLVLEAEIMFAHVSASQLPPGLPSTQFVFDGGLKNLLRTAETSKPPAPEPVAPPPVVIEEPKPPEPTPVAAEASAEAPAPEPLPEVGLPEVTPAKAVASKTVPELMPPSFVTESIAEAETPPTDAPAESPSTAETNNQPTGDDVTPPADEPNSP